ncbi:MAG: hypothetical protein IPN89_09580 [Saprospiraceae bacterium]|nr:hypothetical protein [Saprospiraceae bacterium]
MSDQEDFDDLHLETDDGQQTANIKGNILGLIRTTQRNYINLTNIADNKAHILISINSLMLTILIPIILANYQIIIDLKIYFPLGIFALTCLFTIIFSAMVLIPFSGKKQSSEIQLRKTRRSPFFFTNYADLTLEEYNLLFQETLASKEITNQVIISDLYYFGLNLASKYNLVTRAYKTFNIGMVLSFLGFILTLFF